MLVTAALLCAGTAHAAVFTGEVRSASAQPIIVPVANISPLVLRMFVPDGTRVKKGQPVLRIDAGTMLDNVQTLRNKIADAEATNAKDTAHLQLKAIDAELALVKADAARDKAAIDAAIPRSVIMALDYDRYQGTYTKTKLQARLAQKALDDARAAVKRQRHDGALQVEKLAYQLAAAERRVEQSTVRASHDGVVIHAFANGQLPGSQSGQYEQGSTVFMGSRVGSVVVRGKFKVRAWALVSERAKVHVGQAVRLSFDALPGVSLQGHIKAISGATTHHPGWGDGAYYRLDIVLPASASKLALASGMSVRVDTDLTPKRDTAHHEAGAMHADGSIVAGRSAHLAPPAIPQMWRLNITQIVDDGALVKKGQVVVRFAAGNLNQKLPAKLSELAEKRREQKRLRLSLADDAHTAELATAKARADLDKARRKADGPPGIVAAVKYKKLLIDKHAAERTLTLTEQRQKVAARDRKAQQHAIDLKVAQLKHDVATLRASLGKLTLRAPRGGVFIHEVDFSGKKFDTGSSVFQGLSVATIPDPSTLGVHATLPERDLERVRVGEHVRVTLTGGSGRSLSGHIERIGRVVHSRSRAEPVPVIDLYVVLDDAATGLRPGQPVRVRLPAESKS